MNSSINKQLPSNTIQHRDNPLNLEMLEDRNLLAGPDGDDQISEANTIAVGQTTALFALDTADDVDMFSFNVVKNQRIGIDLDSFSGSFDSYIRLFDVFGNELAANDRGLGPLPEQARFDSYLEYTFDASGTYYLGVSGTGNRNYNPIDGTLDVPSSQGTYNLTLKDITPFYVTAAGPGGGPHVKVFNGATNELVYSFFAYGTGFRGGVRVATGDINNDGVQDIITAAGPGGGPHVRVFDGTTGRQLTSPIGNFFAYGTGFRGGVFVSAADMNGDGFTDIITGAGAGGGPHVKVFSGSDGSLLTSFFAYDPSFRGGVSVSASGFDPNNALGKITTGQGPGGLPIAKTFIIDGAQARKQHEFFAYGSGFRGGVNVAVGDVNGDGTNDIITGAGPGGGPNVKVFDGADPSTLLASYFAYGSGFRGGVFVGAVDENKDGFADIITGTGPGGGPNVRVFNVRTSQFKESFFAFGTGFQGGVFVAAANLPDSGPALVGQIDRTQSTNANNLTQTELDSAVSAALLRLETSGVSYAQIQQLRSIDVQIADLSFNQLGMVRNGVIYIDVNAAGTGWFVDSTPLDDSEFGSFGLTTFDTRINSATNRFDLLSDASERFDLLSVIGHEFGHILGWEHEEHSELESHANSLMNNRIEVGQRFTNWIHEVDRLFDEWV